MRKHILVGALAASMALGLTACNSSPAPKQDAAPVETAAAPSASATPAAPKPQYPNTDVLGGAVAGYEGAIADNKEPACAVVDGVWAAGGNITNPLAEPRTYRVFVSFMQGAETLQIVKNDFPSVTPGVVMPWVIPGNVPAATTEVKCVLRIERFPNQ